MLQDFFLLEASRGDGGMHNVNWEITQRPQTQLMGGIRIGNFHHCSLALLAKWIWHFLTKWDALWQ